MNKETKTETYSSHWKWTELQSKYENSKAEFPSRNPLVIPLLVWLFGFIWFFVSPSVLRAIGIGFSATGSIIWIVGVLLLFILSLITTVKIKNPSYETKVFWKICERSKQYSR